MRILLVEDDHPIAGVVANGLRRIGHSVDWVDDGVSADATIRDGRFDMVVLDLGLPLLDGWSVLERMRGRGDQTPVVVLTAQDFVGDRVRALDAGADDYLFKPFEMAELEARVRAVSRRAAVRSGEAIRVGRLLLKSSEQRFFVGEEPLALSRREHDLLETLLLRAKVTSKRTIQDKLSYWDQDLSDAAIELYVHRLRRKLTDSEAGVTIRTLRGFGYLLQVGDDA